MTHHRNCYACNGLCNGNDLQKVNFKNKNVLDIRLVPGHPSKAWVECYNSTYDEDAQPGMAEYHAQIQSEKFHQIKMKKELKLRTFQQEVAKRVNCLQKLKKIEKENKSLKMAENEANVVLQRTLGMKLPYLGTAEDLQALNKELLKSCIIPCSVDKQLIHTKVEESNERVNQVSEQIKSKTLKAKANLLSRTLETDLTNLPGGLWMKIPIKEDTGVVIHAPDKPPLVNRPIDAWTGHDTIKSCTGKERNDTMKSREDRTKQNDAINLCLDIDTDTAESCDYRTNEKDTINLCGVPSTKQNITEEIACSIDTPDIFHLNLLQKNLVYDSINSGRQSELEDAQRKCQYWKYRKLFMDIERDQVREKKRSQEYQKKVQKLKLKKEEERRLAEEQITALPETSLYTEKNNNKDQQPNDRQLKPKEKHANRNKEKEKELYRYMEALRAVAKERVEFCNITIPPLCQCGTSIWDTHPDMCANNCVYYKNPNAYVRALSAALANTR